MYRKLPVELILPNPQKANSICRMFAKKLRHNIEQIGEYEALTVRPHPEIKGKYQLLNGHVRLQVLRELGVSKAKCDVWNVSDSEARLFLAILNRLRGSDVPELRMNLLYQLLEDYPTEVLASHVPETISYFDRLRALEEQVGDVECEAPGHSPNLVIVDFCLTEPQHRIVKKAIDSIKREYHLANCSDALAKMAELRLVECRRNGAR